MKIFSHRIFIYIKYVLTPMKYLRLHNNIIDYYPYKGVFVTIFRFIVVKIMEASYQIT